MKRRIINFTTQAGVVAYRSLITALLLIITAGTFYLIYGVARLISG